MPNSSDKISEIENNLVRRWHIPEAPPNQGSCLLKEFWLGFAVDFVVGFCIAVCHNCDVVLKVEGCEILCLAEYISGRTDTIS